MKRSMLAAAIMAAALAGCGPTPAQRLAEETGVTETDAQLAIEAEELRQTRVEEKRRTLPNLNWLSIGISTGKTSESLTTKVHRTYAECESYTPESDNECVPMAALPSAYWDAEKTE